MQPGKPSKKCHQRYQCRNKEYSSIRQLWKLILTTFMLTACDFALLSLLPPANAEIAGTIDNSVKTIGDETTLRIEITRWDRWQPGNGQAAVEWLPAGSEIRLTFEDDFQEYFLQFEDQVEAEDDFVTLPAE